MKDVRLMARQTHDFVVNNLAILNFLLFCVELALLSLLFRLSLLSLLSLLFSLLSLLPFLSLLSLLTRPKKWHIAYRTAPTTLDFLFPNTR